MKKYILAFLLLCYFLPSQAQIFYKERIYGQEDRREKDDAEDLDYTDYTSQSDDTFDSTWTNEPIFMGTDKYDNRIYKKEDTEGSISLTATRELMMQKGEFNLVSEIDKYQKKKAAAPRLGRISTYMITAPAVMLFALPSAPATRSYLFVTLGTGIGLNIVGRVFRNPSKKKLYKEIEAYNTRLGKNETNSFDKNFFPNFRPSKIILKPVQMNLLNPTPVPSLGMTWNF